MRHKTYAHNRRSDRGYNRLKVSIAAFVIVLTGVHLAPNGYSSASNEAVAQAYQQPASTTNQLTLPTPNSTTAPPAETLAPVEVRVQDIINQFIRTNSGEFSVSFSILGSSSSAGHNDSQAMDAASLYKPLAAYRVLQRVENEELSLGQKLGNSESLLDCITAAITVSDNPCGMQLQLLANPGSTDALLSTWGYDETTLSGYLPQTSARDQVQLFSDIYSANRISEKSANLLIDQLANQQITDRLPSYEDSIVLHKTGDLDATVNATTLVETADEAYVLSVLSTDWSATLASKYAAIADLHEQIHSEVIR